MSLLQDIDFLRGKIIFNDLSLLSLDEPLTNQLDDLKEDLLQVEYSDNLLLDVGWYPCFSPKGRFTIYVIHDCNWEAPKSKTYADSLENLKTEIKKSIKKIEESLK